MKRNNQKEIMRFTTAGSVDDGKSTLIGRLLYDSKSIFQDQLNAVEESSKRKGFDYLDLSLLTDGLKSEREQGITIDVAYRYFETPNRKFIIADTPGHIEYTRNMVTGASTANLAVILIDSRKGLQEQTHRHSFIASLLGISHILVCVNKMDLVNYDKNIFYQIVSDYKTFSSKLNIKDIRFIPISALKGDNVVKKSKKMNWYEGSTLLYELENIHIASDLNFIDSRFPVQYVIRPHKKNFQDFRGYSGRVEGGSFKKGDLVKILPSGLTSEIKEIYLGKDIIDEAYNSMSVNITLTDDIDISRGNMIVKQNNIPQVGRDINAIITWLNNKPLEINTKYKIKHTTNEIIIMVTEILYEIDVNSLRKILNTDQLTLNKIGRVKIKLSKDLFYDTYEKNKNTGSFIIIDSHNNNTVGAGYII